MQKNDTTRGQTNRPAYICISLKKWSNESSCTGVGGSCEGCAYGSTLTDGEIINNIMTANGRSGVVINILLDM